MLVLQFENAIFVYPTTRDEILLTVYAVIFSQIQSVQIEHLPTLKLNSLTICLVFWSHYGLFWIIFNHFGQLV